MEPLNWSGTVKDLADYPKEIMDAKESLLANSVIATNYDLLKQISKNDRILEIGCGAYSWLHGSLSDTSNWQGIDVYERDSQGRKCIATKLGSVDEIPFANNAFDWVLANQSMEHWSEYEVKIDTALKEIARVLKVGGQAHLNFPLHLHGHPMFIKGDMPGILHLIDNRVWRVVDTIAYQNSKEQDYKGWRRCGFPDFYAAPDKKTKSSFVVNLVLEKLTDQFDRSPKNPEQTPLRELSHIGPVRMALRHGMPVLAWKLARKLRHGRTGG